MKRRWPIFVLVLVSASPPIWAQTLWQTWQMAVAQDPEYVVYQKRFEALSQQEPMALGALLPRLSVHTGLQSASSRILSPQLSGSGSSTYVYAETANGRLASWNVTLSQMVFNWSTLQHYRASQYQVLAAAAQYQAARQSLALNVITDYIQWLAAQADVSVLRRAQRGFAHEAHVVKSEYRAGTTGILGSEEALVALGEVRAQVSLALSRLAQARAALEAITGRLSSRPAPALPRRFTPPVVHSTTQWLSLAWRHNPVLASYRALSYVAARNVSASLGKFLPVITLQLEHQQEIQTGTSYYSIAAQYFESPNSYRNLGNSIDLQLSWNLFAGGSDRAALSAAEARQGEALAALAAERRVIEKDITSNAASVIWARRRIRLYRQSLEVARHAVTTSSEGVRAGLISENNAIGDRQSATTVQRGLNSAIASAVMHYAKVADAAGIITPSFIYHLSLMLQVTGGESVYD